MKKKLAVILAVLIIVSLTGCNSGGSKSSGGDTPSVAADGNGDNASGNIPGNQDSGQMRTNPARLAGEVVSVNGREVSLKVIEMPAFGGRVPGGGRDNGGGAGNDSAQNSDMASGDSTKMRHGTPPDMASGDSAKIRRGTPPDMAFGDSAKIRRGTRSNMASGDAAGMDNSVRSDMASGYAPGMKLTYTGETKTIAIPEGVPISKMSRGDNGPMQVELAIGDVKAGDIMQVWFSDESESVVERVSISNFGNRE